jgi:hypothetical protein
VLLLCGGRGVQLQKAGSDHIYVSYFYFPAGF